MTPEKLEIINGNGKVLEELILTPITIGKTKLEGDFLSNGTYLMNINKLKGIIRLKAKLKYGKGFELKYTPITYHTQNEMVPE